MALMYNKVLTHFFGLNACADRVCGGALLWAT